MNTRFSRLFLAGGQNVVPLSGWFLAGWTPGTTLLLFWFENLALSIFLAARIAAHWVATRKRGHASGFLKTFLLTSLAFTLAHGVFLFFVLGMLLKDTVNREDVIAGLQWMLAAQVASLVFDMWNIGGWPFAEIRARTDWMMGRVVMVHLSILFGMFLFMWMEQPWWFFSIFIGPEGDDGHRQPRAAVAAEGAAGVAGQHHEPARPRCGRGEEEGRPGRQAQRGRDLPRLLASHADGGSEEVRARRRGDGACLRATPIFRAAAALHRALAGDVVTAFNTVLAPLARVHDDTPVTGRTIERCESVGKHLLITFSGELVLRTHMRMSGSWHLYRPGERWQRRPSAMRVRLDTATWVAVAFDVPVAEFLRAT